MSDVSAATALKWQTVSATARGTSHERSGLRNQDFGDDATLGHGAGAIIAVADGHGDELHARSHLGSRFAVETVTEVLQSWIRSANGSADAIQATAARLPETIVRAWREKVLADLERDPPNPSEMTFRQSDKAEIVRRSPEVLYGSTLLAAVITERIAAYLQIGDGDLLTVTADNKVTRLIPGRDDLMINQTESICQSNAAARFRVRVDILDGANRPALVMAATDGYANSYAGDDAAFFRVAIDIKSYLDDHGRAWVAQHIENWLKETSKTGSGDDITVALAWNGPTQGRITVPPEPIVEPRAPGRRLLRLALTVGLVALIGASALWIARDRLLPSRGGTETMSRPEHAPKPGPASKPDQPSRPGQAHKPEQAPKAEQAPKPEQAPKAEQELKPELKPEQELKPDQAPKAEQERNAVPAPPPKTVPEPTIEPGPG